MKVNVAAQFIGQFHYIPVALNCIEFHPVMDVRVAAIGADNVTLIVLAYFDVSGLGLNVVGLMIISINRHNYCIVSGVGRTGGCHHSRARPLSLQHYAE